MWKGRNGVIADLRATCYETRMENHPSIFITTSRGLEPILAAELRALGLPVHGDAEAGVHSGGGWAEIRAANLHLRTAHRVFWRAGSGRVSSPDDLYRAACQIPWEDRLGPDSPFCVSVSIETREISDERYCALKVKDAIADRLRNRFGRRPPSGSDPRALPVFARWSAAGEVVFFYDTSGTPLSFRGYRSESGPAPLRESLAAGLILWSQWDPAATLALPMCGRGALAIEAAWIAMNRAPGLGRAGFAFEQFADHDADAWQADREAARAGERVNDPAPLLIASDNQSDAVAAARSNARRAGVEDRIRFDLCAFEETRIPEGPRWILLNPPYGRRLGEESEIAELYPRIGRWLRGVGGPGRAVVISGHLRAVRQIGLKCSRRAEMDNGPIPCRIIEFPLYPKETST
ncbi:MAG: class I SAM-dependent RNA methyltransferase [Kiritimatiellia bacterium]|nr:class I SAM-dependent RNA methyltransferase [Kiritimatiellia bacterium]